MNPVPPSPLADDIATAPSGPVIKAESNIIFEEQDVTRHGSSDRSFMVDPLNYFSFQPVLHKGHGMCYPVCRLEHIKEPLLLIGKSSPCGGSRFPLSLSEWSFTICLMPYNCK